MTTDTSEGGLETLIVRAMTGTSGLFGDDGTLHDDTVPYGGTGWIAGNIWEWTQTLCGSAWGSPNF